MDPRRDRQIVRYESALAELAEHAELQAYRGTGGYWASERLGGLVAGLRVAYDAYELEGDVAPVRRAIDAYMEDMRLHQLPPDPWVGQRLASFLSQLELRPLTLETRVARAPRPDAWPEGILAVSPEALQALREARKTS